MLVALYEAGCDAAQAFALPGRKEPPSVTIMSGNSTATFYLPDGLRESAEAGEHNFIGKIEAVVRAADMDVTFRPPSQARAGDKGFSLFHMQNPLNDRGVTIRRAYFYPFWQIERSNQRWDWDVARARFQVQPEDRQDAQNFYKFWQKRLFQEPLRDVGRDGFVYVPLQGRLLEQRSFQECSPMRMLQHVLDSDPAKRVIAALHPKEHYGPDEISALEALESKVDRLEIRLGDMEPLLAHCDYIVTQNSGVAFSGFFFGKPSVLFAKIDFHHITANVSDLGVQGAFDAIGDHDPDYAGYVWWFLQQMSVNAGRPEAEDKIRNRLSALGWPV
ncbi:hypothetical protein [uncultured Shimia sp.]|uniref:hypothetical protein n=1 Tax=uncultured Shimia sp. TaxID=573152 RepID=UPI00260CD23F|nr:hypothetical protein [uncultured Shimia sp.]